MSRGFVGGLERALAGEMLPSTLARSLSFVAILGVHAGGLGCSAETAETDPGSGVASEEALVAGGKGALPKTSELSPLTFQTSGIPIFASNNPEIVEEDGVLSTLRDLAAAGSASRLGSNYGWGPAPAPALVKTGVLDAACPNGGVKDIGVYVAHIARSRYIALGVVSAGGAIEVETFGELSEGPWARLRFSDFVSTVATKKYFFTAENARTYAKKSVPAGTYVQLAAAKGTGGYLDGRLRVRANGCFFPYVVSQANATSTTLPTTYASGNVAWKNWYCPNGKCSGEGRLAGLYGGESLSANGDVSLTKAGESKGFVIGNSAQSIRAKARMGDSSEVDFGNYGTNQTVSVKVKNAGPGCLKVRSELVSYVGVPADRAPTYDVWNAVVKQGGRLPPVYWNGPIGKRTDRQAAAVDQAILFVEANPASPNTVPSTNRKGLHEITLAAGASEGTTYSIPVPGMITVPLALTFSAEPCK